MALLQLCSYPFPLLPWLSGFFFVSDLFLRFHQKYSKIIFFFRSFQEQVFSQRCVDRNNTDNPTSLRIFWLAFQHPLMHTWLKPVIWDLWLQFEYPNTFYYNFNLWSETTPSRDDFCVNKLHVVPVRETWRPQVFTQEHCPNQTTAHHLKKTKTWDVKFQHQLNFVRKRQ